MNRPQATTPINRHETRRARASTRPDRHRRRCLPLALAAFSSALAMAACGSSSSSKSTRPRSANKGSPSSYARSQLAAAACIRKHGVPDFPDPTFGAGGAQVNLHAPRGMLTSAGFDLAQKQCAKQGLELAGYAAQSENPSADETAQAVAVARCMRTHGVPNFPDPAKTMPPDPASYPARYDSVGDVNGVIWAVPRSIDLESPAVKHAAAACNAQAVTATG